MWEMWEFFIKCGQNFENVGNVDHWAPCLQPLENGRKRLRNSSWSPDYRPSNSIDVKSRAKSRNHFEKKRVKSRKN